MAVMTLSTVRACTASPDVAVQQAAAECELALLPLLERFSTDNLPLDKRVGARGPDRERLARARAAIGATLVTRVREISADKSDPYDRIAAAEWFIWAETERRRVMPKGRGRPRKEAIR